MIGVVNETACGIIGEGRDVDAKTVGAVERILTLLDIAEGLSNDMRDAIGSHFLATRQEVKTFERRAA